MTLANGRHYLAIPGPSVMPDRVLQAMHQPAPNIYTGALVDMVESIVPDLKAVAQTEHNVAIYISNGHGAWEAALANTVDRGDKVLVLSTGRFASGWGEMAAAMGANVEVMDFGNHDTIDLVRVEARLAEDRGHDIKAILCVQVDTSTSVKNDIAGLRRAIDAAGHPALFCVDCIACLGVDEFHMDAWGVDIMVTGSQKGLMTPPGLAFVFFNDKAHAVRQAMPVVSQYWDWTLRAKPDVFYQFFCGTAPTHHIFGLREALSMLVHEEGLEAAWARHAKLASMVWTAFDHWATEGAVAMNIGTPALRSHAVTAARAPAPKGTELRTWLTEKAGVTLGIGLGMAPMDDPAWHGFFRVGHMGHVNAQMVMGVLGAIEAGLVALDIPHGPGALAAAARIAATA